MDAAPTGKRKSQLLGEMKRSKRRVKPADPAAALSQEGGSAGSSAAVDAAGPTWESYNAIYNEDAHTLILGTAPSPKSDGKVAPAGATDLIT